MTQPQAGQNGVKLVSITQEIGDDPMHVMMRQIIALLDEYHFKENAKHTLRAMKENARQGFWNGSRPPIGYRLVAAKQRGAKVKKRLEIDPLHTDRVRLIFRLSLEGNGSSSPWSVKAIANYLNARGIFTRDSGRWGIGHLHRVLTRTTCAGRHQFNRIGAATGRKSAEEIVSAEVPPIIDQTTFDALQARVLRPERLVVILAAVLDRRQELGERRERHAAERQTRAAEADLRLKRLYAAIENGAVDPGSPDLKERIGSLKATRDQARADADRAAALLEAAAHQTVAPAMLDKFVTATRDRMRIVGGGFRRDYLRALAQRVEVADGEVTIIGPKDNLLRTLTPSAPGTAMPAVLGSVPKWRPVRDSNPCYRRERAVS